MTADALFTDGMRMIGVLVLIVGGLIVLNLYIRRNIQAGGGRAGRRISVLENTHLGVKKSIAMVQVPGAVLVLGVTADRITLLERIDDPEGKQGKVPTAIETTPGGSFKDRLQQLTSTFSRESSARRLDESG